MDTSKLKALRIETSFHGSELVGIEREPETEDEAVGRELVIRDKTNDRYHRIEVYPPGRHDDPNSERWGRFTNMGLEVLDPDHEAFDRVSTFASVHGVEEICVKRKSHNGSYWTEVTFHSVGDAFDGFAVSIHG